MTLIFNNGSINGSGGGGSGDSYTKAETNALLSVKASTSLDNLNADGQMIIDSVNGTISNCILEIPQNIKCEISNNVVTLKSGSVVTISGSTYSTITTTSDISLNLGTPSANEEYVIFPNNSVTYFRSILKSRVVSGSTDSLAGTAWHCWFDTTNRAIYTYGSDGTTALQMAYPICVVKTDENSVAFFAKDSNGNDMIFNGAGFIGHHAFVYPNVKGLTPNGFNADGSLKSSLGTSNQLTILELPTTVNKDCMISVNYNGSIWANGYWCEPVNDVSEITESQGRTYVRNKNMYYTGSTPSNPICTQLVKYKTTNYVVEDYAIVQPIRLATTEMLDKVQDQVDTNTTAISGKAGLSDNNTFTGDNTFSKAIMLTATASESETTYYGYMYEKVINIDYTVNPSYNGYYYNWMFRDKNNKLLSYETSIYGTSGNSSHTVTVQTRNSNNTANVSASYTLNIARDGNASFTIPAPTQDNTTSTQADTVGARNTKLQGYANNSLSNLSSTGQMVVDSQNGTISNCILEIPQNLKLTLENNVLTLKAGSVLTKTGSTYTTLTTTTDKTYTISSNQGAGKYVVLCQQGNGTIDSIVKVYDIHSGTTAQRPEDVSIGYKYFNVDTKQWNLKGSSAWNENWGICYPICVIDVDSNHVASFAKDSNGNDMIFNGCGFIGHHAFVYPNVKALLPDEFGSDRVLKSELKTTGQLSILDMTNKTNARNIVITTGTPLLYRNYKEVESYEDIVVDGAFRLWYVKSTNTSYESLGSWQLSSIKYTRLVEVELDANNVVTKFDIRQPYEGARNLLTDDIEEEVATKQVDVTTLTGYDSTQTQTLKNINGVLTWVTD